MLADLYFQNVPSSLVLKKVGEECPEWPKISGQLQLLNQLNPANSRFLVNADTSIQEIQPPITYRKHIFQLLEKELSKKLEILQSETTDEEEAENLVIADEFMEEYLTLMTEAGNKSDEENTGYVSYTTPLLSPTRIPIYIKRSHNQVGTKVWSAGLFLIELFHCMNQLNPSIHWQGKTMVELGAGVGVTGIVAGWGIIAPTLSTLPASPTTSMNTPCHVIMTDFHPDVLAMIDHNIALTTTTASSDTIHLSSAYLDWNDTSTTNQQFFQLHRPQCLIAADCTYSPDLNRCLVQLFRDYFAVATPSTPRSSSNNIRNTSNNGNQDSSNDVDAKEVNYSSSSSSYCLPNALLEHGVPFVLIACTIRQPETYQHFLSQLQQASDTLLYFDLTTDAHQWIAAFGALYCYDFRDAVQLLCIVSRRDAAYIPDFVSGLSL